MPDKNEVIKFLEDRLAIHKEKDPQAWNLHQNYEGVINDLMMEE